MATATKLLTAEEYAQLSEEETGPWTELVRGVVVPKFGVAFRGGNAMAGPGVRHGKVQLRIGSRLLAYCDSNNSCQVMTESGTITVREPDTVRGPDISLYTANRMPINMVVVGYHDHCPNLCVEVVSPSNSKREIQSKTEEYLSAGVEAVWIVDPEKKTLTLSTRSASKVLTSNDTLDGGELLPGFSCKVADFFK